MKSRQINQIDMQLQFRQAQPKDLSIILQMLANDQLGSSREDASLPIKQDYLDAFSIIRNDPNNELIVVESDDETNAEIIGILQLTYIPYLTYKGSWRCLIEGVRIHQDHRGKGYGTQLFKWAIARAKQKHCNIVQLTSNKIRDDALRFYQSLSFKASHEGFKLML